MRDTAIRNTHPSVTTINAEKDAWDKDGNVVELNETLIAAEVTKLETEYAAQEYARKRKEEYPDWSIQLEKIYNDGLTKWKSEMVDPVKTKWPKDNSGPK